MMSWESHLWTANHEPRVQIQIVCYPTLSWPYGPQMPFLVRQGRVLILINGEQTEESTDLNEDIDVVYLNANYGYSGAHNRAIHMAPSSVEYILTLNPDVLLDERYVPLLVHWMDQHPQCGSVTGKLLRFDNHTIDSTGIVHLCNHRWVDRGQGQLDRGQFDHHNNHTIFGISGAAGCYRRRSLEEIAEQDQIFDEDLFLYKEDVDVAWRLKRAGWTAYYLPEAIAYHERHWNSRTRKHISPEIKRRSLRNRYLVLIKNISLLEFVTTSIPWILWELSQFVYLLVREPRVLKGYISALKLIPKFLTKRRNNSSNSYRYKF
ncbi:glycosyltransferase family 2 protein [Sulfobacillus thermosulfidooxidans]|uniref:glycosyltransferase family 2 protein n=1 Tax=Sulfobacillus thermosulfidooxidans TaxID=28034 RepID=UPI001FA78473|nr:glycosyltransferase family 2 protein [Sulfobacillus thermosulfidooxidans]